MSDELLPQAGGEAPTADQESTGNDTAEVAKLRQEAAKWRTKLRETETALKELQPLAEQFKAQQEAQKTTEQKLAEQIQEAQAELAKARAEADAAKRGAEITRLAIKAGVPEDVLALLDTSKIPVDDEAAALKMLQPLAAKSASGASNPARGGQDTSDDLRKYYFGGGRNRPTIFGG